VRLIRVFIRSKFYCLESVEKYSEGKIHKTTLFIRGNTELSVATGTNQQMQSKCSCPTVIIPKRSRVNKQGQFPQISINATVETLKIRQNDNSLKKKKTMTVEGGNIRQMNSMPSSGEK